MKPRFVINPEGIKGSVGPVMHVAMNILECVPTFKGRNADGMSELLKEVEKDFWISGDGSNWDNTQYHELF